MDESWLGLLVLVGLAAAVDDRAVRREDAIDLVRSDRLLRRGRVDLSTGPPPAWSVVPATSTVPMPLRASAPGPVTSTSGRCPKTVVADVISTGRSRVSDASRNASSFFSP